MTVHEKPWGDSREWFTPPDLFARLGLRFDLDPASPMSGPVPWVPADRFYSPSDNGLVMPWVGRVWLNPPYGPALVPFVHRMVEHVNGLMLVPARTETRWFQYAAENADRVCFLRDRLHFTREDGFRGRASHASVLMAFGYDCKRALMSADLGWDVEGGAELNRAFRAVRDLDFRPVRIPAWDRAGVPTDEGLTG